MTERQYGLSEIVIRKLCRCFEQYPGIEAVIIFGSRAKGTFRQASDIDFVIRGSLNDSDMQKLENELDDLLLPYKIDLSLLCKNNDPALLERIERDSHVFFSRSLIS